MATTLDTSRAELEQLYARLASEYCRSLPLEHFMESTDQAKQREITLESLALVRARWPEFQVFSELLILYPLTEADLKKPTRVCPDNMVVVHDEPIVAKGSFNVPLQPAGPTLILEYVSTENKRKDYEDNRRRYANDLQIPYYLLFEPEVQKLTVFRLSGKKYVAVKPNPAGRLAIPPLKLEVALLDGWVRFWFEGELLPLPGDLMKERDAAKAEVEALKQEIARLKAGRTGAT
jgi:Uma2 family endonuclease